MVAIVTDAHHAPAPYLADPYPTARVPAGVASRPAAGGQPAAPAVRAALVVVAIVAVLLAAVGTAAVGRVLDAQRGVPATADGPAVVVAD
ncbi:hypothetical protein [Actinomarinicola tropica]|uniref:Uncharacterized protein n=1 Tax=Actinomarinicola tropica TaxID=2789776 RepID=A0A5Q2RGS4_9ACTN|nr:hypothetical protein [Actinomarinicola tropica]QGG94933.1 hypothetical protein GH723_07320 [Actinomarinicola tropica]